MNRRQRRKTAKLAASARLGAATISALARVAALGSQGRFAEAEAACREVLARAPDDAAAHRHLGLALLEQGRLAEAVAALGESVRLAPADAAARDTLAVALCRSGTVAEGVAEAERAAALAPRAPDIRFNLAKALELAGRKGDAEAAYRVAVGLAPGHATAWNNLGNLLQTSGRPGEAEQCYRRALAAAPGDARARYNLATALMAEGRDGEAEREFRDLLAALPSHAEALNNLGALLDRQDRFGEAREMFERALRLRPDFADAWFNLGNLLDKGDRLTDAAEALGRAAALAPASPKTIGALVQCLRKACAWDGLDDLTRRLVALVRGGAQEADGTSLSPFAALSLPFDEAEQQELARRHAASLAAKARPLPAPAPAAASDRLRVGYLSADFREHPVAHLIAGLFPLHDRRRFAVYGYSVGIDDGSPYRRRIAAGFDVFRDLHRAPAAAIASRIRDDGIQVLFDLTAYTRHGRSEALAFRPAPVQVNYLGYPGTMGARFVDYIVVDPVVLPPAAASFYDERPVYLPHCYQANDRPPIAPATPSRSTLGLADDAFVFCCFNSNYKIDADAFEVWMRILSAVPASVLWLFRGHPEVETNLRREAARLGLAPERLAFAGRLPKAEHLARHRAADLFLDTFCYGAHTTASDALWAGLPMLTMAGDTFARRVGASLLSSLGLAELIASDRGDYERMAVALAGERGRLAGLRARLARALPSAPLFDTERFVRDLERAIEEMWQGRGGSGPIVIR